MDLGHTQYFSASCRLGLLIRVIIHDLIDRRSALATPIRTDHIISYPPPRWLAGLLIAPDDLILCSCCL